MFYYSVDPYLICKGRKFRDVVDGLVVETVLGGEQYEAMLAFAYSIKAVDQAADHAVFAKEYFFYGVVRVRDAETALGGYVFVIGAEQLGRRGGENVSGIVKMQ